MRGDMILMYKILLGGNQSLHDLFAINESKTWGHNFKLYKLLVQTKLRETIGAVFFAKLWM